MYYNAHGPFEIPVCKYRGGYLGEKWCDEDEEDVIEEEKTKEYCT